MHSVASNEISSMPNVGIPMGKDIAEGKIRVACIDGGVGNVWNEHVIDKLHEAPSVSEWALLGFVLEGFRIGWLHLVGEMDANFET